MTTKMRLHQSPNSPFVRKVRVAAIETGLIDRLELFVDDPRQPDSPIVKYNPLRRIPALELGDGESLFESVLICEYLDGLHDGPKLFPADPAARWQALRLHALGDGVLSYAVFHVNELRRPEAERSPSWMARWQRDVGATLDTIEARVDELGGPCTIGTVTVACALGYLDFRFAKDDWRRGRPALARWYEAWSQRPSMTATVPPGP
jgi:glutathione S-transferase